MADEPSDRPPLRRSFRRSREADAFIVASQRTTPRASLVIDGAFATRPGYSV
jgi:hypothetical protein